MIKKIILLYVLYIYTVQLNCCSNDITYELIPAHDTHDLESGLNRLPFFSAYSSASTESLPDRDDFQNNNTPVIIQRRPLSRSEISWRITKYAAGAFLCAGIGVGSYFLAENLMHEEDRVNDYLIGYNQSLTAITNDINELYNMTAKILEKLSGL